MITRISQTFIKTMRGYVAGDECGNIIKRMFIDEEPVDYGSEKMEEGKYFEFLVTGSLGRDGKVPEPKYMKGSLKRKTQPQLTVEDMTAEYRRAHFNAMTVIRIMKEIGLKIVFYNKRIVKGRIVGDIDIICEFERDVSWGGRDWKAGDRVVIDLKYSGLLNDRWNKLGWMFTAIQKEYHGTQAKQYYFLTGLPFMFWVVGSTNPEIEDVVGAVSAALTSGLPGDKKTFEPTKMKVFYIPVTDRMVETHLAEGNRLLDNLKTYSEIGFVPRPSYLKCLDCPLNSMCKDRKDWPHPEEIDLEV